MYFYLYDSFLTDKKYEKVLAKIESRLTDLGISGKIGRLTMLKNASELVEDEINRGAKTVVIVGDDKTLNKVLNGLAKSNVTVGYIPMGSNNEIAKVLGIKSDEEACDILSARKIEKLDLGKANSDYFLSSLELKSDDVELEFENGYKVIPKKNNEVVVYNLASREVVSQIKFINPQDGLLETLVEPSRANLPRFFRKSKKIKDLQSIGNRSFFPTKRMTIRSTVSDEILVKIDGQKVIKTPVKVEVVSKKIKIIVGKERLF